MQLKGFSFTQIFLYCMAGYLGMDFYSSLMLFVGDVSTPDVECHHWWEGKQGSTFEFKSYMFKNLFKVRCCSEAMWHRLYSAVYEPSKQIPREKKQLAETTIIQFYLSLGSCLMGITISKKMPAQRLRRVIFILFDNILIFLCWHLLEK